ncbi:hypothetical protein SAY87_014225 [Trapa incisa]|uniref:BZIP domain-containing protein n=1 Tax=Trapa incisa TaxID=236973 RepID=A0AAN7JK67_9MYRT|nr:hypothetical protein SAY87_014225 [Trapa incisa]
MSNCCSSWMSLDGVMGTASNSGPPSGHSIMSGQIAVAAPIRSVNDVWREIVSGEEGRRVCKEEVPEAEIMTLEDFLLRAGASVEDDDDDDNDDDEEDEVDVKLLPPSHQLSGSMFAFEPKVEPSVIGFEDEVEVIGAGGGGGLGGKRGSPLLEPLDRAAQQRQRRMIKNRESAARSRERKQAYQAKLESLAAKLEEENGRLLKEKAERTKERHKQLMEGVVPFTWKPKLAHALRRVRSMQCCRVEDLFPINMEETEELKLKLPGFLPDGRMTGVGLSTMAAAPPTPPTCCFCCFRQYLRFRNLGEYGIWWGQAEDEKTGKRCLISNRAFSVIL